MIKRYLRTTKINEKKKNQKIKWFFYCFVCIQFFFLFACLPAFMTEVRLFSRFHVVAGADAQTKSKTNIIHICTKWELLSHTIYVCFLINRPIRNETANFYFVILQIQKERSAFDKFKYLLQIKRISFFNTIQILVLFLWLNILVFQAKVRSYQKVILSVAASKVITNSFSFT